MSSIKISELNPLNLVTADDFFPLVDSGSMTTYRVDVTSIGEWMRVSGSCLSASYAPTISASYALSASWAPSFGSVAFADSAKSASWASSSLSASYALTASYAITSSYSITSSYAITSSYSITASYSINTTSASYASASTSASHAKNADTASYALGSGGDTVPIGTIIQFAATSIPNNWLECNGDPKLITSFQDLYDAIQTTAPTAEFGYKCTAGGARDAGGTFFKLPDLRGEFVRGWDNLRGIDAARVFASAQGDSVGPASFTLTGNLNNILNLDKAGTKKRLYSVIDPAPYNSIPTWRAPVNSNPGGAYIAAHVPDASHLYGNPAEVTTAKVTGTGVGVGLTATVIEPYASPLVLTSAGSSGTETRPRNIALVYCIKYSNAFNYADLTGVTLAGDVTGNYTATVVGKIQTVPVDSTAPTTDQYLKYDGTKWTPSAVSVTSVSYNNTVIQTGASYAGGFVYNNELYLTACNSSKSFLYKVNLSTRAITYLLSSNTLFLADLRGHVFTNPNNSYKYFIGTSLSGLMVYNIDLNQITHTQAIGGITSAGQYYPAEVSWGASSTIPSIVTFIKGANSTVSTVEKDTYILASSNSTIMLDLTSTQNSTTFNSYCFNTTSELVSVFDYNNYSSKKRYYCITNRTGLLHIFKHISGNINSQFNTTDIQYEKTIIINSAINQDIGNYNQISIQYNPVTGAEIGILKFQSCQSPVQPGFVEYIPWSE